MIEELKVKLPPIISTDLWI